MAAHRSFIRSPKAFTVCALFCSVDDSALLILPLVNGCHHGSRAVLLSGWQWIAHSSARQRLSPRFARYFAQRMTARCSYFRSSTAFTTVCAPFCSADGSGLLILPLVNGFHDGSRAVLLSGGHRISNTSPSSTAFPTVCAPYCSADDCASLLRPLAKGFHGLRAVFLSGWQRIAPSSARQRLSRFARRFPRRIAAHCSFFSSSTSFAVCAPFCSADGSGLLILPLINCFPDGLRDVLLSGGHRISHTSALQQLARRFARRFALRMAAHRSFVRSPKAFTVCAPFSLADGSASLVFLLVNVFCGLRAVFLSGW